MAVSQDFLQLVQELRSLLQDVPDGIGLDDHSVWPFQLGRMDGGLVGDDRRLQDDLLAYIDRRERIVLKHIDAILDVQDLHIESALNYFFGCISNESMQMVVWRAHAFRFDRRHRHLQRIASLLVSRELAVVARKRNDGPNQREDRSDFRRLDLPDVYRRVIEEQLNLANDAFGVQVGLDRSKGEADPSRIVTLILHGTWAAGTDWWRRVDPSDHAPKSKRNLWHYLKVVGVPGLLEKADQFGWSGHNSESARRIAARELINWWHQLGKPTLNVVAHSHGGNVAMFAAMIEPNLKFRRLILLGTPARIQYLPRAAQTEHLHNVFSQFDSTQTLGSWGGARGEGRTQSDHLSVTNWHVPDWAPNIFGVNTVGHSDLHDPEVWENHQLHKLLE